MIFDKYFNFPFANLSSSDKPVPAESIHRAGYAYSPSTNILSLHCSSHDTLQVLEFCNTAERSNDCNTTVVSLRQSQSRDSWCHVKLGAKPDLLLMVIASEKLLSSHIYEVIKLRHKKRFIAKNLCSLHWRTYICWVLEGRGGNQPIFNCSPYTVLAFSFESTVTSVLSGLAQNNPIDKWSHWRTISWEKGHQSIGLKWNQEVWIWQRNMLY